MLRRKNTLTDGLRLGELISSTGLISTELVTSALKLSEASRLPLGRVLISMQCLTDVQMAKVLQVQRAARAGGFAVAEAKRMIKQVAWNGETKLVDLLKEDAACDNILVSLLRDASILTKEEVGPLLQASKTDNLCCGRILLLRRRISSSFHKVVLEILVDYKKGKYDYAKATELCAKIYHAGRDFQADFSSEPVNRLGGLFLAAGLINETELVDALETSLTTNGRIGEALANAGLVMAELIDICVSLLQQVQAGNLPPQVAVLQVQRLALRRACKLEVSV
jgi:hypothetical protein